MNATEPSTSLLVEDNDSHADWLDGILAEAGISS
jgi:hypothetical protein